MDILLQLLLQFVLIGLNAFFACAEIAVLSVNDAHLAQLMEQGDKKAMRIARFKNDSASFLATIQVAITLSGFLGSAFAADNFSGVLTDLLAKVIHIDVEVIDSISVILVTLILSYFTLVLGELVPKRLAMKRAESLALSMSGVIRVISICFQPVVAFLSVSTNVVLRLFGIDPNAEDETVYEDDIKDLVDQGSRVGEIDSDEREIIHNLFEFDDISVGELATHRTDLTVLFLEDSMEDWHNTIITSSFSYFPVCGDTTDDVVGVLSVKKYHALDDKSRDSVMNNAVSEPCFVPAGMRADALFKQMKKSKKHFVVVLDEYGGVSGIATMKDLIAQIVGDFDDEADVTPDIVNVSDKVYDINGTTPLNDVATELAIELPVDEFDTFGGYIMGLFETVPDDGEIKVPETEDLAFTHCIIENHRIISVRVTKKERQDTEIEE
ncbi:MAG: HlyC/CorC family transporter [Clostridia bacterium]|nr:HlyC/CorC family transporter [Clostridia bacterium]